MRQAIHYYFIQHGETQANQENKIQGWSDSPLTEKGIEQLTSLSKTFSEFPIDLAYSSDLKRSIESSKIVLSTQKEELEAQPLENLREYNYGGLEGLDVNKTFPYTFTELVRQFEDEGLPSVETLPMVIQSIGELDETEECETFMGFWDRIEEAILRIHDEAIDYRLENLRPEVNVAIFTHSLPMRGFFHEVLSDFDLASRLDYGHYAEITYHNGLYTLDGWNLA